MIEITELILLLFGIFAFLAGYGYSNAERHKRIISSVLSAVFFVLLIWCLAIFA